MDQNRRDFIKSASAFAAASMLPNTSGFSGAICLFSKHLPSMDWARMAQAVKKLGFGGIDLTVRPGGHVQPERAPEDLPKAVAAIRADDHNGADFGPRPYREAYTFDCGQTLDPLLQTGLLQILVRGRARGVTKSHERLPLAD